MDVGAVPARAGFTPSAGHVSPAARILLALIDMSGQSNNTGLEEARSVQLFWADLDEAADELAPLESVMASDELRRARRFREARLRSRWMAARALLRHLLSLELDRDPGDVRLQTTDRGKPYLPGDEVAFNLSHSGPHLVIALAPLGRVGVDVECIRPLPELTPLVERHFTRAEADMIFSAPRSAPSGSGCPGSDFPADPPEDDGTLRAFFRTWVRKEALLKAVGLGISAPLDRFQVAVAPDPSHQTNLLLHNELPGEEEVPWQVRSIAAPFGAVAAVAWDTPGLTLVQKSLQVERST